MRPLTHLALAVRDEDASRRFYEHYFPVNYPSDVINIDRYGYGVDGAKEVDSGEFGPRRPATALRCRVREDRGQMGCSKGGRGSGPSGLRRWRQRP